VTAPRRGPDGRYGCQAPANAAAPVSVTCYGCEREIPAAEPIWVNRERILFIGSDYVTPPLPVGPWCAQCERTAGTRPWKNAGHWDWSRGGWVQDPPRTCGNCGRLFHALASRYCSDRCANIDRAARRREAREAARQCCCERCGHRFTAPRSDARYCSPACRQAAYRQRCAEQAAARAQARTVLGDYDANLLGGAA
jgi:hypothetical protein